MIPDIMVQFVGFEVKALVREYTFTVREASTDPRQYTLTILNQAFNERRLRIQDAPDICSSKLRRELATYANHPPNAHYRITDAELDDYRSSHTRPTSRMSYGRKPTEDY